MSADWVSVVVGNSSAKREALSTSRRPLPWRVKVGRAAARSSTYLPLDPVAVLLRLLDVPVVVHRDGEGLVEGERGHCLLGEGRCGQKQHRQRERHEPASQRAQRETE